MSRFLAETSAVLCLVKVCGGAFPSSSRLHRHLKSHAHPDFACDVQGCGRRFKRREQLERHGWSHAAERPFRCSWPGCCSSFADAHGLQRHMARLAHGCVADGEASAAEGEDSKRRRRESEEGGDSGKDAG
mmetsp:Transcript_80568/g.261024  ORF Transcript_80568/g.261024 Transcript_80568/m.261024 type:complete len:131 (+) Transcript_80568:884-1276(+)